MRRFLLGISLLFCGLLGTLQADTFKLANGDTVTGELLASSANDVGVQVKVEEGQYQRIPWASFSQEDLRKLAAIPKLQPLVEPFVEMSSEERIKKTEVPNIKQPPRLQRPASHTLIGAMFSSALGFFMLLILYSANIYAGYEVAIFRARPPMLLAGLSAIPFLGFLVPIIFLSMGTNIPRREEVMQEPAPPEAARPGTGATAAPVASADAALNPMQDEHVAHPAGLRLAHSDTQAAAAAKPALPETVVFRRGQFTFNRRFFETKFPGFFGVVRRDADKDMVLLIKAARGEYLGQRISRIAANDLHLQIEQGEASQEVMIPFQEIQEIQLKHKDA